MDHLKVDLDMLGQTGQKLKALSDAFTQTDTLDDTDKAAIGESHLVSTVQSFTSNWSQKRKKMQGSLQSVSDMANQAHDQYKKTDDTLADSLKQPTTSMSGNTAKLARIQ